MTKVKACEINKNILKKMGSDRIVLTRTVLETRINQDFPSGM